MRTDRHAQAIAATDAKHDRAIRHLSHLLGVIPALIVLALLGVTLGSMALDALDREDRMQLERAKADRRINDTAYGEGK